MSFIRQDNIETLKEIEHALQYADNGFYLFTTRIARTQPIVLESLSRWNIAVWDYAEHNQSYRFGSLANWAEENKNVKAFVVLNLQIALKDENDIFNFNLSRDMLIGYEKPWIFGITANKCDEVCKKAVDFYSFVRMRVDFTDEFSSIEDMNQVLRDEKLIDIELTNILIENYMAIILKMKNDGDEDKSDDELLVNASIFFNVASLYRKKGEYAKALSYYERAKLIREKVLGEEHPNTVKIQKNMEITYNESGNPQAFVEWLENRMDEHIN